MVESVLHIPNSDWGLSKNGLGGVVQGDDDIKQCIFVILFTPKGADPLRPLFGSDLYKWIDKPVNIAGPNIVTEIIEAVGIWEKRAQINSVKYYIGENGKLAFDINMTVVSTKSALQISYPNDFNFSDSKSFDDMFDYSSFY